MCVKVARGRSADNHRLIHPRCQPSTRGYRQHTSTYMYTTNYVLYVNIHTFYTLLVKISTLCTLCHLAIHCVKELRLSCASTVLETLLVSLHSSGAATGIVGGGEGITVSAFYGKPACLWHKLQPAIKWPWWWCGWRDIYITKARDAAPDYHV